jgi:hypothetical protein
MTTDRLRIHQARQALASACEGLTLLVGAVPPASDLGDKATARRADLLASLIKEACAELAAAPARVVRFPGVPVDGLQLVSAGAAAEIAAEVFDDLPPVRTEAEFRDLALGLARRSFLPDCEPS